MYLSKTLKIIEKQTHHATETRNVSKYLKRLISAGQFRSVKSKQRPDCVFWFIVPRRLSCTSLSHSTQTKRVQVLGQFTKHNREGIHYPHQQLLWWWVLFVSYYFVTFAPPKNIFKVFKRAKGTEFWSILIKMANWPQLSMRLDWNWQIFVTKPALI